MANYTLTKIQTALVSAGRSQVAGEQGDMFYTLWDTVSAIEYNAIRDVYLALEELIADKIEDGFAIVGTDENGGHPSIGGMPSRPRPKAV